MSGTNPFFQAPPATASNPFAAQASAAPQPHVNANPFAAAEAPAPVSAPPASAGAAGNPFAPSPPAPASNSLANDLAGINFGGEPQLDAFTSASDAFAAPASSAFAAPASNAFSAPASNAFAPSSSSDAFGLRAAQGQQAFSPPAAAPAASTATNPFAPPVASEPSGSSPFGASPFSPPSPQNQQQGYPGYQPAQQQAFQPAQQQAYQPAQQQAHTSPFGDLSQLDTSSPFGAASTAAPSPFALSDQPTRGLGAPLPVPTVPTAAPEKDEPPPNDRGVQWDVKRIVAQLPDGNVADRQVVQQNELGATPLIALVNVLLLRGELSLTPPNRPAVDHDYLSSLVGEYLLGRDDPTPDAPGSLEDALSVLPYLSRRITLNASLTDARAFPPPPPNNAGSETQAARIHRGVVALFRLAGVDLVHGGLLDATNQAAIDALRLTASADVDRLNRFVSQADAAARQVSGQGLDELAAAFNQPKGKGRSSINLNEADERAARAAVAMRNFLSTLDLVPSTTAASPTGAAAESVGAHGLSWAALFALGDVVRNSAVETAGLAALYRAGRVDVIYIPTQEQISNANRMMGAEADGIPGVFVLANQQLWRPDDDPVWLGVSEPSDPLGSGPAGGGKDPALPVPAPMAFDGRLHPLPPMERRTWLHRLKRVGVSAPARAAGSDAPAAPSAQPSAARAGSTDQTDSDFALALHLQEQENRRASQRYRQQRRQAPRVAPTPEPMGGLGHEWYDPYNNAGAGIDGDKRGVKDLLRIPGLGKKKKRTDAEKYAPGAQSAAPAEEREAEAGWDSDNEYAHGHDSRARTPNETGREGSPVGTGYGGTEDEQPGPQAKKGVMGRWIAKAKQAV